MDYDFRVDYYAILEVDQNATLDDEKEEKVDGNDDEMKDGVGKDGVGNEKVNGNSGDGNDEGKDDSCLVVTIFNYLEM
jgi:hypothetical protein